MNSLYDFRCTRVPLDGVEAVGVAVDLSLLLREVVGEVHDLLGAWVVHVGWPLLCGLGSGRRWEEGKYHSWASGQYYRVISVLWDFVLLT